jgi:chromosome segregation ATPase|uniref:Uncharacterized protein n=1 Tax=Mesoaciditoga lauensis TaxID=1495039 RepID=A0A7V3VSK8_9BACT
MADITYSVKIDEELKEKITAAIKNAGTTGKEFFSKLLEVYDQNSQGEVHVKELAELDGHLSRIRSIYSGLVEDAKLEVEKIKSDFQKLLDEKGKEVDEIKEKVKTLEDTSASLNETNEKFVKEREACAKKIEEFEEKDQTNTELIKEYREKIRTLESTIHSYDKMKEEDELLRKQIEDLKVTVNSLSMEKIELSAQITQLKAEIDRLTLETNQKIENLSVRANMEKQTELMKEKQDCQERIRLLTDEQRKQFEEYNSTIKKLYAQIDEMRDTMMKLRINNSGNSNKNGDA